MTDAEIVAYNLGVRVVAAIGPTASPGTTLAQWAASMIHDRERAALARLGPGAFWTWVDRGRADAMAKAAR